MKVGLIMQQVDSSEKGQYSINIMHQSRKEVMSDTALVREVLNERRVDILKMKQEDSVYLRKMQKR